MSITQATALSTGQSAKNLAMVSFTLVVYDHAITFAQEVTFFWSGSWSTARILYLSVRYLALIEVIFVFYGNVITASSAKNELNWLFTVDYILVIVLLQLCQCVVTLRVWHLFPRSCFIRFLAAVILIVGAAGTAISGGLRFHVIKSTMFEIYNDPLTTNQNSFLFLIYLPSLLVHTTMLSLTIYRFYASSAALQRHGIIHRFLKEGVFVYVFAAGTLLYEIVALSLTDPRDFPSYYVALGGEIAVATAVVSVCRAMLSIRSLAATYHVDPAWLLNHAELSRVQWRRGATEGEIFVEVNEMDVVLPSRSLGPPAVKTGYLGNI